MLQTYFADLHIHIGRDLYGNPVKITGSKHLTITNILKECSRNKGIHFAGVIDSQAPAVQEEILQLIEAGYAKELTDGGIRFEKVTLILGAEIEIYDDQCKGPIHVLCFLPTLEKMACFSKWLTNKMSNITLSSQRYYGTAKELQLKVQDLGGLFILAHVFTPFKSVYGKGVERSLTEVFDPKRIDGVELGLSSDTSMAEGIKELQPYPFLTNSDAHSLAKIGREYQEMLMCEPSFLEFKRVLKKEKGRKITKNFGMDPRLGKYYVTVCKQCERSVPQNGSQCPACASDRLIKGVRDRIAELTDLKEPPCERPPYLHQVPLEYLPTLGPKTYQKLLKNFGTEMNVIHYASYEALKMVVSDKLAKQIIHMRKGDASIETGGGGKYGRIR